MKEHDILGFNPSKLENFKEDNHNLEEENYDDWLENEYQKAYNDLQEDHIKNCLHREERIIRKFNGPLYIYLAGKISKNGWRESIRSQWREFFCYDEETYDKDKFKNIILEYDETGDIYITGPWFIGCDHGCFHGESTHGVGLKEITCDGTWQSRFTEAEVKEICFNQIEHSDVVFAYINDNTCYGTIAEIGYAYGLDKHIILLFDSKKRMSDMWFITQLGDYVDYVEDNENLNLKERFNKMISSSVIWQRKR